MSVQSGVRQMVCGVWGSLFQLQKPPHCPHEEVSLGLLWQDLQLGQESFTEGKEAIQGIF
jgi:hypothetical protein